MVLDTPRNNPLPLLLLLLHNRANWRESGVSRNYTRLPFIEKTSSVAAHESTARCQNLLVFAHAGRKEWGWAGAAGQTSQQELSLTVSHYKSSGDLEGIRIR